MRNFLLPHTRSNSWNSKLEQHKNCLVVLDTDRYLLGMKNPLIDPFARAINYLRISVTDRCDFRCVYCMSENMTFLPKRDLLTLEELDRLCSSFIDLGVQKLRVTGGEPLVRRDIMSFFQGMKRHLDSGALKELTLTTNGSQLHRFAEDLFRAGVRRINISIVCIYVPFLK